MKFGGSLLTKHGKFYELNPYKLISRLQDIGSGETDGEYGCEEAIDDLIEDIYEQLDLPR